MEGAPIFPEYNPGDDKESSTEKKDKKDSKEKRPSSFEQPKEEAPKKSHEFFKDDKAEKKDADEEKIPLETLADDEKKIVAEQYVEARTDEVKDELVDIEPDTPNEAAVLANAALLENIQEMLDDADPVTTEMLDEAVAETLEELGLEDLGPEDPGEFEPGDSGEAEPDDDEASTTSTTAGTVPPSSPPPPPASPPSSPAGPPPPPSTPYSPLGGPSAPAPAPMPASAPRMPAPEVLVVSDRKRERTHLLVGGIVGYMIGRRRGRIKTEKKLLPIQEKLKKEVIGLQDQIALREKKIRVMAREQAANKPQLGETIVGRMQEKRVAKKQEKPSREKLGKFAVLAERPGERLKPVERMTVPELLEVAQTIKVEGPSVKQLYESSHLNQDGLRRVVQSFLRGERYGQVVRENIISPEIYRTPFEQKDAQTTDNPAAEALKQVLGDPGTGTSFALPSLNQAEASQPNEQSAFVVRPKKTTSSKAPIIAGGILAVLLLLAFILLT